MIIRLLVIILAFFLNVFELIKNRLRYDMEINKIKLKIVISMIKKIKIDMNKKLIPFEIK